MRPGRDVRLVRERGRSGVRIRAKRVSASEAPHITSLRPLRNHSNSKRLNDSFSFCLKSQLYKRRKINVVKCQSTNGITRVERVADRKSKATATQFLRDNSGNGKIVGVNLQNTNHMKTDRLGVISATVYFIIELLL